jgi:hypothetical protein
LVLKELLTTKSLLKLCLVGFIVLPFFGCSQESEDVLEEWRNDGWSYVITHGEKGSFARTGTLQSKKARAVEASWVENGNRKTKLYQQTSHYFVVLRFIRDNKNEFVIVMKKRK